MTAAAVPRLLGRVRGEKAGPTLLVVAAIHGNEPAGAEAARRVFPVLDAAAVRGEFTGLVGNAGALATGVRQRSRDLNRAWDEERVAALRAGTPPSDAEDGELLELDRAIEEARAGARGPVHVLDLHTTSGDGPPFSIAAGEPSPFAASVPLTCVTGLLELLDGTLLVALARRGVTGLVVEAGRHDDPLSADRAEAAIWLALSASGVLGEGFERIVSHSAALLTAARRDLPPGVRVFHRHAIRPADGFRMRPGYRHFQRVAEGEVLADSARGEVRAAGAGYVLMPLYQVTGSDGFFLGR